ncbi:MAG: cytochrome b/b6 domain-containing protein [Nitrospirota bacterium]
MNYDRVVRWLHAGMALAVVIQMLSSMVMQVPQPGRMPLEPQHAFFLIHEASGLTVVTLLVLHWLWALSGYVAGGWGHLFPWFSRARLQALLAALKALPTWLRDNRAVDEEVMHPLVGAVHGLGLLTVMALTGATMVLGMGLGGSMGTILRAVRWAHGFFANFMWAYVMGHVAMALLHQVRGERLLTKMFDLRSR